MIKYSRNSYALIAMIMLLIMHLITLKISPLPWFDEVCFADISYNLLQGNGFKLSLAPYLDHFENVIHYGPIFFTIQAGFLKLFGLNPMGARMPGFLFAIIGFYLLFRFIKREFKTENVWAFILLGITLPTVSSTLHNGRMEFVAIFFWIFSLLVLTGKRKYKIPLAGLLMAGMLLTSPRSGVLLFGHVFLIIWENRKSFKNLFISGFLFGGVIFLAEYTWALISMDGLFPYLNFLSSASDGYVGGGFPFLEKDYPLLVIIFASLLAIFYQRKELLKLIDSEGKFYIMALINILVYLLFVNETGPYLVYLVFSILIVSISLVKISKPIWSFGIQPFILIIFGLQVLKFGIIMYEFETRSSDRCQSEISEIIPSGEGVLCSDVYYYLLNKNGNEVFYIHHLEFDELLDFANKNLNYRFLVLSEYDLQQFPNWKKVLQARKDNYREIASLDQNIKSAIMGGYLGDYQGIILERIR